MNHTEAMLNDDSSTRELADTFAQLRKDACSREIESIELDVERVAYEDPKSLLPAAHPTITREMVLREVRRTTSEALRLLGFTQNSNSLPLPDLVRSLAKAGRFDGLGNVFTQSSEIASLWHQKTAYSPLALAPQYGSEDVLPLPQLRADGSTPQAHEPDRRFGRFIPVPADDPARAAWRYHPDTIELRKRGLHLRRKLTDRLSDEVRCPDGSVARVAAIAGGAAWPDIYAVADLLNTRPNLHVELDVFDWDRAAIHIGVLNASEILGTATNETAQTHLDQANRVTTVSAGRAQVRFIETDVSNHQALQAYAHENGSAGYDVVEAVGLVEYFTQDSAPFIIATMDSLLKDESGMGVIANMTAYHDHPQILGVIGWRSLRPRSLREIIRIVDNGVGLSRKHSHLEKSSELLDGMSYLYVSWEK
ncbi:MAG: hypothetical protein QM621_03260 [Aeromicrobium sp.]|uniref:hypothetical protein n=1 Tax=Aeromicrobium sp. TaxID=1871063 RepID=UPI0039E361D7